MTTTDMALLGHAVEELDALGLTDAAAAILRADGNAEINIALCRAIGELGGRLGWERAGHALDAAREAFRDAPASSSDYARALFGVAR